MPEKEKEQDSSARLVRRLAQLKYALMKKIEETKKARESLTQCRTSTYLFDQVFQRFDEATNEELKKCVEESVWQSDYAGKKGEVELYYSRMKEAIAGVAVEFEEVCVEQEKQKKVEEAVAAAAAG